MKILKWVKRIFIGTLMIVCLLLIIGFVFENISRSNADKKVPDGQFVKVDGHQLHYLKKGEGKPTVVFETAFDPAGHLQWYNLQNKISKFATTISYDRAGILWSERGKNLKSGEKIAEELHILLEKTNVPKPYILVGHSMGGMLIRFFINKYPQDVAGVILIDAECPNDELYLSPKLYEMVNQGLPSGFLKFANSVGLVRLMYKNIFPDKEEYKYQNTIMPALIHKSVYGLLEEGNQMPFLKKDATKIKSFGNIPLCIISATDRNRFDSFIEDKRLRNEIVDAWDKMQKDLLNLSTDSKQIIVPNSSHYITQDQPKVIEDAVESMINKINIKP